jgi:hypothetical protein
LIDDNQLWILFFSSQKPWNQWLLGQVCCCGFKNKTLKTNKFISFSILFPLNPQTGDTQILKYH